MRFSFLPLLLPIVLLAAFTWGVFGVAFGAKYELIWWWLVTIVSGGLIAIAIALHVYTIDDRIRRLEETIDRLANRHYADEPPDREAD